MRTMFLTAAVLLAFATPTFAQTQSGQQNEEEHEHGEGRGRGPMGFMGRMQGREQMEGMMRMASALSSGTFFRLRRGEDEIDIHCPPSQQLQDCVNGAIQLMRTAQQTGSSGADQQR